MMSDGELLRRYTETSAEEAFGELVQRHVNLVYSTALRQVNSDVHLAQDVSQSVFAELARQASGLSKRNSLAGWLYTATVFIAAKAVRNECRRRAREQEAHTMCEPPDPTRELDWQRLRPLLDEIMRELKEADREAVLLRFFENRPHSEIGARLGVSENTARMRVERALDKLRAQLFRRGWVTTTATLSAVISAHAVQVAPVGLAAALISSSLATAAAGTGISASLVNFMATTTKLKIALAALAIAAVGTLFLLQHADQVQSREETAALRDQLDQLRSQNESLTARLAQTHFPSLHLPVPTQAAAAPAALPPDDEPKLSFYDRIKDQQVKLTAAQIAPYLAENRRNAASLLAGFRTTGDAALLEEAKTKFPNDPQVAFEAAFQKDITPEAHHQWIEAMKRGDPNNSFPDYLSALDHFKSGQADQAVQELLAASRKTQFQDYTLDRGQDDEEAFRAAGYSMAEAKTIPARELLLPQLAQIEQLGLQLVDLAASYRQTGDEPSAQAALQMAVNVGQRYGNITPGEPEISQLVGLAVEQIALSKLDPNSPSGATGQTVQDQINQITQRKSEVRDLNQQLDPILSKLSDQDWISYKDRWRIFGEESAVRWAVNKYGAK